MSDKSIVDIINNERIKMIERKYSGGEWTSIDAERLEVLNLAMSRMVPSATPEMWQELYAEIWNAKGLSRDFNQEAEAYKKFLDEFFI